MSTQNEATLAAMKAALGKTLDDQGNVLNKAITQASNITTYDLQAPAKNLYPTITPLRNMIPRVTRANPGTATNWKQITAPVGSGFDAMGWVPEGQRSGVMNYSATPKSAGYVTLGEEDNITFEAENAAKGFEDINATMTMRLLQKMMRKEEMGILGGNATLTLGTPGNVTMAAAGSGQTLPAATYGAYVVALTFEGFKNSTLAGGVATTMTITGADGKNFVLNGGSSNKAAQATQAVTLGQTLSVSTPAVIGAVAYAWFVGVSGSETLQAITPINSAVFNAPLTGGRQSIASITQDNSVNANYSFNGLLTNVFLNPTSAYFKALNTGTPGTGSTLTASGKGSVVELDTMIQNMWDTSRLGVDIIMVSSQQLNDITTKVLSNSTAPLLRYDQAASSGEGYELTAGGKIRWYYNPFLNKKVEIMVHPDMPTGTIFGYSKALPETYQSNEVPNPVEMITRRDYYRMDWPLVTRQRQYGVYCEETMACYAPFAFGVITNISGG